MGEKKENMSLKDLFSRIPGGGRTIALVLLVLATSISFALGFFVGKSSAPTRTVANVVKVPAPRPAPAPEPVNVVREQPAIVIVDDPLQVRTAAKPSPPKRVKKASAPAPKAEPAQAPKPASSLQYSVQVGAFETLVDAEQVRKKFEAKGYKPFVLRTGEAGQKAVFKVRIGEFADNDAARLLSVKLKSIEGIAAFVVTSD